MATLRTPRIRHLRHGASRGYGATRRRRVNQWIAQEVTDLSGTGADQTFTANPANDQVTITGHGFATGDGPFTLSSAGTLPAGLMPGVPYWVNVIDANTVTLHVGRLSAGRGEATQDITDAGTGAHNITPGDTNFAITEIIRQGVSTQRIETATDIDDLI